MKSTATILLALGLIASLSGCVGSGFRQQAMNNTERWMNPALCRGPCDGVPAPDIYVHGPQDLRPPVAPVPVTNAAWNSD